ncbi:MAG: AAA family ATPase [Candidatus Limnocylindria bacterium]
MTAPQPTLAQAPTSLGLDVRRATNSLVGRPVELLAIEQALRGASAGLSCLVLEGEPGIGKTRLLLAGAELARGNGWTVAAVTADEEIHGPFLVARSILTCPDLREAADATGREALERAVAAISGHDESGLEALSPDRQLLRVFDLAAVALRAAAATRQVALLIDDLQWADDDSVRLLRYLVRTAPASPILFILAMRSDAASVVTESTTLLADMERLGLVRRLRLGRFTQVETVELLRRVLGGDIAPASAATMHAQAEGVPFIVEEIAQSYRANGMLQRIDGAWTLAPSAEKLMPSAVRTLIHRRAARLPAPSRTLLAEAAVLGHSFSLRDLEAVKAQLADTGDSRAFADLLAPAVTAGLLIERPSSAAADYTFTHEQIREFAASLLSVPRRRSIHGALVDLLTADGEPPDAVLPLVARHALAAGDTERTTRYSLRAAEAALRARAPEEVLRVVDLALPLASAAQDRMPLLLARDGALTMLRRPSERIEALSELGALADALHDPHRQLDVLLRRAAALRSENEFGEAAELARTVRGLAAASRDRAAELAAVLELGQALLHTDIGEGVLGSPAEADLEGAADAYGRAIELARELGDSPAAPPRRASWASSRWGGCSPSTR